MQESFRPLDLSVALRLFNCGVAVMAFFVRFSVPSTLKFHRGSSCACVRVPRQVRRTYQAHELDADDAARDADARDWGRIVPGLVGFFLVSRSIAPGFAVLSLCPPVLGAPP